MNVTWIIYFRSERRIWKYPIASSLRGGSSGGSKDIGSKWRRYNIDQQRTQNSIGSGESWISSNA